MDQRTRKLMTMRKVLHPGNDVERLYMSRRERGSGLASIEDSVDASIQRLEDYIKSAEEDWLQPPQTIQTTQGPAERQLPENKSEKKNNFMDVLSDWQATSQTRKRGRG